MSQVQMSPQQLVQDAEQKQQSGDLEGAVQEYRQFLKLHPEVAAIHSNLGAALAGLGRYEEALPEYKTALKQSPKLVGARLNLALVYYKMGKLDDAATELEKVHAEGPQNHQATLLLGDCYMRMGRDEDVIRVLEPAEQKYPDDLAIAYLLGTALIHQKRVDEGQILVDRILRNGDSAEAHLMLGTETERSGFRRRSGRVREGGCPQSQSPRRPCAVRQGVDVHRRLRSVRRTIRG
jgi:tetratricopeptide (TPR) repeat protein